MVRLIHLSGSLAGQSFSADRAPVRIGRSAGCDVRFDGEREPGVSFHHAELLQEGASWVVQDCESDRGVLVNGRKVARQALADGDRIALGEGGPELRFELNAAAGSSDRLEGLRSQNYQHLAEGARHQNEPTLPSKPDDGTAATTALAQEVARRVAEERARAGGKSSGQTVFIMSDAMQKVEALERKKSRKKWLRLVAAVAGGAAVVAGFLGLVIVQQRAQIRGLVEEKTRIDAEILAVHEQMRTETDENRLEDLETRLAQLSGTANEKLTQLSRKNSHIAEELEGDELDRDIRAVLKKFNAETYSVPPVFKDALKVHIQNLVQGRNMERAMARKARYWPTISKALMQSELPVELGYIAYVESSFDPEAYHPRVGARGMWQFIAATARTCGLRVDDTVDERLEPEKASRAAAHYLSKLLVEFGEESFMLALASYNKGEAGVRRALHKVAKNPGGFRQRDFWHLYRLKLLPDETREYVPAVIAAAIVMENPGRYLKAAPPTTARADP